MKSVPFCLHSHGRLINSEWIQTNLKVSCEAGHYITCSVFINFPNVNKCVGSITLVTKTFGSLYYCELLAKTKCCKLICHHCEFSKFFILKSVHNVFITWKIYVCYPRYSRKYMFKILISLKTGQFDGLANVCNKYVVL